MRRISGVCLVILLSLSGTAYADDGPWWTWSTMTGDWGGYRTTLADHGITFQGGETATFQTNTGGAPHSNHNSAFASQFNLTNEIDFGKLAGLTGFLIHSEFWWQAGNSLSDRDIGNLFEVSHAYEPNGAYLGQLYAQQTLLNGGLQLQLGRLSANSTFAALPVFNDYVSAAINSDPANIPLNTSAFTSAPSVEWGAVVSYAPVDQIELAAGIYDTDPSSAAPKASANGTHFSLQPNEGVLTVGQVSYKLNQAKGDAGLPGTYSFGGFYAGNHYTDLNNGHQKAGNYGFYAMAQQMVYRDGGADSSTGLTPWAAVAWQPQENINLMPFFLAAGATYQGLIASRADDTTALMVAYGKVSDTQQGTTGEVTLEVNYTVAATPWLAITPDFQYIINPSGRTSANDAAVFGAQLAFTF
ncbi:MAG TPA: carbohydrate porin [Dongiaceae bacterium]|nr:carbohydrate porin [Dongiaceae bacterium]